MRMTLEEVKTPMENNKKKPDQLQVRSAWADLFDDYEDRTVPDDDVEILSLLAEWGKTQGLVCKACGYGAATV